MPLSNSTSKTKKTSKRKTPSFICEVPLQVTRRQERILEARQAYGFSAYALEAAADEMRRTTWLAEHLDSHVAQKLADRAFEAVQKVAFGKARKVRFKGKRPTKKSQHQLDHQRQSAQAVSLHSHPQG